jgi:hypothetical protein
MIIGYMAIQSAVAHLGTLPLIGSTLKNSTQGRR